MTLFLKFKSALFYIILFLLSIIEAFKGYAYDYDLWARLIAGKAVLQTGNVLKNDFLSYTPTHIWYDHEWGSSVIFYFVQNHFGHWGLFFLQGLLIFSCLFIISKIIKLKFAKDTYPYNLFIYSTGLILLVSTYTTFIRCHWFSFLFFCLFLYILELARKGQYKPLVIIPFLTIIWNNMHGGVVSGLGIILVFAIGEFLNKKPFKHYLIILIVSSVLLTVNPYGFEYIKFLFNAVTMPRVHVLEWWGLFQKYNLYKYLLLKSFILFVFLLEIIKVFKTGISYVKADKLKILLFITTLFLAISHVKMIPFFVIVTLIYFYKDFYNLLKLVKISNRIQYILYIGILTLAISVIHHKICYSKVQIKDYPLAEVEFIKKNNIKGNIFCNLGLGSYVAYKLYPDNLIFIDGRYEEVYDEKTVNLLDNFFTLKPGWEDVLKNYKTEILLIEKNYPVYKKMFSMKDWYFIFGGEKFAVFVKQNNLREKYKYPSDNINYYRQNIFDTDISFKK